MSVRRSLVEDEREKSNHSGLAAAAVGVGVGIVGAALFYFLNKRSENNPQAAGGSSSFRERSWTLEECSICCDVILKNQKVMSLPCTHQFHAACVMPWLQQKQTCPNCRKNIY